MTFVVAELASTAFAHLLCEEIRRSTGVRAAIFRQPDKALRTYEFDILTEGHGEIAFLAALARLQLAIARISSQIHEAADIPPIPAPFKRADPAVHS